MYKSLTMCSPGIEDVCKNTFKQIHKNAKQFYISQMHEVISVNILKILFYIYVDKFNVFNWENVKWGRGLNITTKI